MRLAILQPSYLPWLGYFDQMNRVDTFVYLDDVQYTRRDWRNRNRIRTPAGWMWLTVPVLQKNQYHQSLKETRIDAALPWQRKHKEAIRCQYARAPHFETHFPYFDALYGKRWTWLVDLCVETTEHLKKALTIPTRTVKSSELQVGSARGEKILALCAKLGAQHYLSGDAARAYLSPEAFAQRGIGLEYQNYRHPQYPQRHPGFVPYLSVIDLLFNVGEASLAVIENGHSETADLKAPAAGVPQTL